MSLTSSSTPQPVLPPEHRHVLLEAAEIIIPAAETEGDSSGIVVPQRRLHADREPLPAGSGGEVRMEVEIGRRGAASKALRKGQPPSRFRLLSMFQS